MRFRDRVGVLAVRALHGLRNHAGLFCVLAVALIARLIYLRWFKSFPPGDVFNFINIARALPAGDYPPGEKRLPLYPLLILLFRPLLDWEVSGLFVAVGSSLAALVLFYALGRTMGLARTALCAVLLPFQIQQQVFIASTRAYADATLIALLPASLLALLRTRTARGGALTGFLLGAAALTRYEGTAAAALLLPLWLVVPGNIQRPAGRFGLLKRRFPPLVALAAFLVTLLPYGVLAVANDRPVFGAGYFAEGLVEKGRGAPGITTFAHQAAGIWDRVGLTGWWGIPGAVIGEIVADPFGTPRILAQRIIEPEDSLALLSVLGAVLLLVSRRWWAFLILLGTALAVTLPPAWYTPYPRYDAFLLFVPALLAAAGLTGLQRLGERGTSGWQGRVVRVLAGVLLVGIAGGLWTIQGGERIRDKQRKHNGRDYALYQAIHAARRLPASTTRLSSSKSEATAGTPGRIAFTTEADIVGIYFGERAVLARGPQASETPAAFLAQLRTEGVTYAVVPDDHGAWFPVVTEPTLKRVTAFAWLQGDGRMDRASIYELQPPRAADQ